MTRTASQRPTHRARRLLDAVKSRYPGAWQAFDGFRRDRGASPDFDWPDWCFMPIAAGYAVASGGGNNRVSFGAASHPAIITALATWRMTQGIYRFDPDLLRAVLDTPLDGDIPVEHLQRLPEWCVYVELDQAGIDPGLHGVWLHMEYDVARGGQAEFRIVFDRARDPRQPFAADGLMPFALPLVGNIVDSLEHLTHSATTQAALAGLSSPPNVAEMLRSQAERVRPLLALALYLCSDADITRQGQVSRPQNPASPRGGNGIRALQAANSPTEWDVGTRVGAALRAAYAREAAGGDAAPTGRHVRPHVRRAHWHTILSGPRKRSDGSDISAEDRRRDLRWLPPIPVNVDDLDTMPSVVRPVR